MFEFAGFCPNASTAVVRASGEASAGAIPIHCGDVVSAPDLVVRIGYGLVVLEDDGL
jgi:hypothetical protein